MYLACNVGGLDERNFRHSWLYKTDINVFDHSVSLEMPVPLRFSQFSGCWLILSVYILMSFDFPFVRLFGVRQFCYYPYCLSILNNEEISWQQNQRLQLRHTIQLENTEGAIQNWQSRERDNTWHTRRRKTKQEHNTMCWTPLYANKHIHV